MTTFRIVHLSDLHFSTGTNAQGDHTHSIPHLQAIETRLKGEDYDRVVVSGDVSNTGDFDSLDTARRWLTETINVGNGVYLGLEIPPEKLIIVPGNHDAFNATRDNSLLQRWQKSLANFNSVFPNHRLREPFRVGYHWLEREGAGIYIATVDSCYLGDPGSLVDLFSGLDFVAKGDLTVQQSKKLLELFDRGIRGILEHPTQPDTMIDRGMFADSLKILVMHHYIFDPSQKPPETLMTLVDQRRVFTNLALADFDVLLCGHSHIGETRVTSYGAEFESRAQQRYFFNVFRRNVGIDSLPLQYEDRRSSFSKMVSQLLNIMVVKQRLTGEDTFIEDMVALLKKGLVNPDVLAAEVATFLRLHSRTGEPEITASELDEVRRRLSTAFKASERKQLEAVAEQVVPMIRALSARPFLQVMNGSACKAGKESKKRSFNVYRIEKLSKGWRFHTDEYKWDPAGKAFPTQPFKREHPFHN